MKRTRSTQILSILMSLLVVIGIITVSQGPVLADSSDASTGLKYVISNGKASVTGFSAPTGFGGALTIPETLGGASVTGMYAYAFRGCTSLTSVVIPQSMKLIGIMPFLECSNLTTITVNSLNTAYKNQDGMLFSKDGTRFICCPEGKSGSITIPSGVKRISNDAFFRCKKITGITIPDGVTEIGYEVFEYCSSLANITIPASVTSIGYDSFKYCSSLAAINVDSSNGSFKSSDGVLYTKSGAELIHCPQKKSGSVSISDSVTSIDDYAFEDCSSLTGITIPNSVTSIGYGAFIGCSGLTSIRIPGGITSIDIGLFYDCINLASFTVDESNTAYKSIDGILFSKDGTTLISCPEGKSGNIVIPNGVTSIADCGFDNCLKLRGITIPNSVTSIGEYAFCSCEGLTSMTIPSSVTTIRDSAFCKCYGLRSIALPSGVTSIEANAFQYCFSLTNITIPNSVTTIGSNAFANCGEITGITIPLNVTSIGNNAFAYCYNLKGAYFYGNAPAMGSSVFQNCDSAFTIHYLDASTGFTNPWNGYTTVPFTAQGGVSYQTHVQDIGWQDYVMNGATSGTSGQSKRLEAIKINLKGISGGIEYKTHVQDIGWQDWVPNDALSGTSGQAKRLEAIKIRLTGEASNLYDVYYRVHAQNVGWMDWAKNGESSGTAGFSYRLEAIEIVLVKKGDPAPGSTATPFIGSSEPEPVGDTVTYRTHVQDYGWMNYVMNGATSGTSGESKRMEAIQIKLQNLSGGIEYRTHVQDYGWMDWVSNDALSGTSGQSKRLEAIEIRLTGEAADKYDIYYRVHAQNFGWMGWAKNGDPAGTAGYAYRLEAVEILLVPKGYPAPGPTDMSFAQA